MKKIVVWIGCFLCLPLCAGCTRENADLEDREYILALGVDWTEDELEFTCSKPKLTKDQGGEADTSQVERLQFEGKMFEEAWKKEEKKTDKKLEFGHMKAILLSEDLIEKEEMLRKVCEELWQENEILSDVPVVAVKGKASDLMKAEDSLSKSIGEYTISMMKKQNMPQKNTLMDVMKYCKGEGKLSVPVLERKGKKIQFLDKMYEKEGGEHIYNVLLRFHMRANSNEKEDQDIKIQVKNDTVKYLQQILWDCSSKQECKKTILAKKEKIEQKTEEKLRQLGVNYDATVYLSREQFPIKQYGDLVFPEGEYEALRIDLGRGKGKNWWCMLYPSLCFFDSAKSIVPNTSKEKLKENLTKEEYDSLQQKNVRKKVKIKWKTLEYLDKFL